MPTILMYSTGWCPFCTRAESYLRKKGVGLIEKKRVDQVPGALEEMMARTGRRTVPQLFIDERHIGGFDDLVALDRLGGLEPLLT